MVGYIQGTFRDGSGHVISGGSIVVYVSGTTTLATIYSDVACTIIIPNAVSGLDGSFIFYVSDIGTVFYDLVLSAVGYETKTYSKIYPSGRVGNLSSIDATFPTNMTGLIFGNGSVLSAIAIPTGLIVGSGGNTLSAISIPTGIVTSNGSTLSAVVFPTGIVLGNGSTLSGNAIPTGLLKANGTAISAASPGTDYEASLGNPGVNGYVLSSTTTGTRSWIIPGSGPMTVVPVGTTPKVITLGANAIYLVSILAEIDLPNPLTIGDALIVYSTGANVVTVKPNAADRIVLNGVAKADGVTIVSDGVAGTYITLVCDSADGWTTLGGFGVFT